MAAELQKLTKIEYLLTQKVLSSSDLAALAEALDEHINSNVHIVDGKLNVDGMILSTPYNQTNFIISSTDGGSITTGVHNTALGFQSLYNNTSSGYNTAVGYQSLYNLKINGDFGDTAIGWGAGKTVITGGGNVFIGDSADGIEAGTGQIAIGYNAKCNADNQCVIGSTDLTVIRGMHQTTIGGGLDLGASDYPFRNVYAASYIQHSDRNLKDNIVDTPFGLEFVEKLHPVQYKFKDYTYTVNSNTDETEEPEIKTQTYVRPHQGFIAQEVEEVLQGMGIDNACLIKNEYYSLRYSEFIAPLTKAIQELSAKVKLLEQEISVLKNNP
jgi:hypothetical protein